MEKGKIEAYTLMEIAVAMLLAGLCISICYTAYGLIGNYFSAFEKKNNSAQLVLSLQRALDRDIDQSRIMLKNGDGLEIHQDSSLVRYRFGSGVISREVEGLRTDSFVLTPTEIGFNFEGREAVDGDTVDRVGFVLSLEKGGKVPMVFKKVYSAQDLFR
ncbi:hypothetical protein FFJ24_010330 [Pedobacter sp. KBS0701]|uniref:hypothetical protein n=1 Tax=Pedobacter sp. KBS0701 TaxID=2578106 RepID=UPI00110E6227|nr:hypothetical protein [Pedobacter sp. KBS0701]QDW25185.1 hypothetical protein FFJ24_010330 [Pedobacter sp. KBS0701]